MVIRVKWLSDRPEMIWPILKLGIKIKTIEQQAIIGLSTYLSANSYIFNETVRRLGAKKRKHGSV